MSTPHKQVLWLSSLMPQRIKLRTRVASISSLFGAGNIRPAEAWSARRAGRFWVYPILREKAKECGEFPVVGLRIDPFSTIESATVVRSCHAMSTTLCLRDHAALMLIIHSVISNSDWGKWDEFLSDIAWSLDVGAGYLRFADASTLVRLQQYLESVLFVATGANMLKYWAQYVEHMHVVVDKSDETRFMMRAFTKCTNDLVADFDRAQAMGSFVELWNSVLLSRWFRERCNPPLEYRHLQAILNAPLCIDGGIKLLNDRFVWFSNWRRSYSIQITRAVMNQPNLQVGDVTKYPESIIMKSIIERGDEYDGAAHLELSDYYTGRRDYRLAWNMLMMYSFHHYRSRLMNDPFDRDVPGYVGHLAFDIAKKANSVQAMDLMEAMGVRDW